MKILKSEILTEKKKSNILRQKKILKEGGTPKKLKQLKYSEIKKIRYEEHEKQNRICPLLKKEIPHDQTALDHKHKKRKQKIGVNNVGLCRGVVHKQANSLEGKISNSFRRMGLHKLVTLPAFLRNLADYLEDPPMKQIYIHPKEAPKKRKLMKSEYNRIKKYYFRVYPNRKKVPKFPKKGYLSKKMEKILNEVNIIYYKEKEKK